MSLVRGYGLCSQEVAVNRSEVKKRDAEEHVGHGLKRQPDSGGDTANDPQT